MTLTVKVRRVRGAPCRIKNLRPGELSGRLLEWHPTCLSDPWRGNMQLFGIRVFEDQKSAGRPVTRNTAQRLRALTAVMLTLAAGVPSGFAQQQTGGVKGAGTNGKEKQASELPAAPAP